MGVCSCCVKICTCCSAQVAKCVLGAVNGILITVGVVLAIIGCILHWGGNLVFQLLSSALNNIGNSQIGSTTPLSFSDMQKVMGTWVVYVSYAGIALLVVGLFLVATGLVGAIGACCDSKLLIIVYIVIMAILALACAGLAAGYIVNKNLMRTEGAKQMTQLVKSNYKGRGSANEFTNILDLIQARVPCCGVENHTIFSEFSGWNSSYQLKNGTYINEALPESCCKISGATFEPTYENCTYSPDSQNSNINEGGCYTKLWSAFDTYSAYATYGLFIAAGVIGCIAALAIIILVNLEKSVT